MIAVVHRIRGAGERRSIIVADVPDESGLHEYIDAEFTVEKADSPTAERTLRDALENLEGVQSISLRGGKVAVNYEPVSISEKQLHAAIERAGFRISSEHVTTSSPLTDAFIPHPDQIHQPPPGDSAS
ncbi:MAG: heavy-metal-associated domain-containing protein [Chthoniobacterales bacterium]